MNEPSLDDLRLFLAVACECSLSAAAKRLSASSATLSRRINQLEQQIGRSLFHRQPSGYELTADGDSLRERVLQLDASRTLLDLAVAGAGVTVLPCFVGDRLPCLRRVGPLIDQLTESQWLVMHSEPRHRPAVRTVFERLGTIIDEHVNHYCGKCQLDLI